MVRILVLLALFAFVSCNGGSGGSGGGGGGGGSSDDDSGSTPSTFLSAACFHSFNVGSSFDEESFSVTDPDFSENFDNNANWNDFGSDAPSARLAGNKACSRGESYNFHAESIDPASGVYIDTVISVNKSQGSAYVLFLNPDNMGGEYIMAGIGMGKDLEIYTSDDESAPLASMENINISYKTQYRLVVSIAESTIYATILEMDGTTITRVKAPEPNAGFVDYFTTIGFAIGSDQGSSDDDSSDDDSSDDEGSDDEGSGEGGASDDTPFSITTTTVSQDFSSDWVAPWADAPDQFGLESPVISGGQSCSENMAIKLYDQDVFSLPYYASVDFVAEGKEGFQVQLIAYSPDFEVLLNAGVDGGNSTVIIEAGDYSNESNELPLEIGSLYKLTFAINVSGQMLLQLYNSNDVNVATVTSSVPVEGLSTVEGVGVLFGRGGEEANDTCVDNYMVGTAADNVGDFDQGDSDIGVDDGTGEGSGEEGTGEGESEGPYNTLVDYFKLGTSSSEGVISDLIINEEFNGSGAPSGWSDLVAVMGDQAPGAPTYKDGYAQVADDTALGYYTTPVSNTSLYGEMAFDSEDVRGNVAGFSLIDFDSFGGESAPIALFFGVQKNDNGTHNLVVQNAPTKDTYKSSNELYLSKDTNYILTFSLVALGAQVNLVDSNNNLIGSINYTLSDSELGNATIAGIQFGASDDTNEGTGEGSDDGSGEGSGGGDNVQYTNVQSFEIGTSGDISTGTVGNHLINEGFDAGDSAPSGWSDLADSLGMPAPEYKYNVARYGDGESIGYYDSAIDITTIYGAIEFNSDDYSGHEVGFMMMDFPSMDSSPKAYFFGIRSNDDGKLVLAIRNPPMNDTMTESTTELSVTPESNYRVTISVVARVATIKVLDSSDNVLDTLSRTFTSEEIDGAVHLGVQLGSHD